MAGSFSQILRVDFREMNEANGLAIRLTFIKLDA